MTPYKLQLQCLVRVELKINYWFNSCMLTIIVDFFYCTDIRPPQQPQNNDNQQEHGLINFKGRTKSLVYSFLVVCVKIPNSYAALKSSTLCYPKK